MKKLNQSYVGVIVALTSSVLIVACAGANRVPPPQYTPVQSVVSKVAATATATTVSATASVVAPSAAAANPTLTPEKPTPRPTIRPTAVRVPGAMPGETVISVTGQVWDVAASARVIDLVEPVHGINAVAVDDKTEISSADGKRGGLEEIKPGMVIQASGQADGHGAVLANKIRILTAPSPLPAARPSPN